MDISSDFMWQVERKLPRRADAEDAWLAAHEFIKNEMPTLQEALEDDFRGF